MQVGYKVHLFIHFCFYLCESCYGVCCVALCLSLLHFSVPVSESASLSSVSSHSAVLLENLHFISRHFSVQYKCHIYSPSFLYFIFSFYSILGAFAKSRQATISFVMSVRM
jgi:hypothetical protein